MTGCDPCPTYGNTTERNREQIAQFVENAEGGTQSAEWGPLLYDECGECGHILFEDDQRTTL